MKNVVPPTQRLGAFDICIRLLAMKYNLLVTNDLIVKPIFCQMVTLKKSLLNITEEELKPTMTFLCKLSKENQAKICCREMHIFRWKTGMICKW